jgi:hypothetical protein
MELSFHIVNFTLLIKHTFQTRRQFPALSRSACLVAALEWLASSWGSQSGTWNRAVMMKEGNLINSYQDLGSGQACKPADSH